MTKRLSILLVALLAFVFAVAAVGCGDDDDDSGDENTPAETESTGGGGTATEEDQPGTGGGATVDPNDPAVKQAVESCKQSVTANSQLSAGVKKDLEGICEEAATGDADAVRKATKDVCVKIIEETTPAGAARDTALKACDQATATP